MVDDIKPAGPPEPSLRDQLNQRLETAKPKPETFKTPDEAAAVDDLKEPSSLIGDLKLPDSAPRKSSKHNWREKLTLRWPPGKKEYITAAIVIILAGLGVFLLTHHTKKPVAAHINKIVKPAPSKTVPSTLSGLPVDRSTNLRPVTGVMIENSQDARPQAGLSEGMVVFEAIAEGGITRFLALYQDTAPGDIGPVRSARPYYVQWSMGFDAGYAHVGGSPEALADIKAWGVRDLDQFANSGSYHRISSRAAPHNVYTSMSALNQLEASKGYTSSTFTGFVRKKEAPLKVPTAKSINLNISSTLFNVHYDYDATHNDYGRNEGGAPHIDANGGVQVRPKVVVAMVMTYGLEADDHHSQYGVIGHGVAYVFQDGNVTIGSWTKVNEKSQIIFLDGAGKSLGLNPGQTWLTAVSSPGQVIYTP